MTPQPGIFALGTAAQTFLELDLVAGADPVALVRALANVDEPAATLGGANVVLGLRPSLWAAVAPQHAGEVADFTAPVVGPDGFTMPATQHDAWLWIAGPTPDLVFDVAMAALAEVATLARPVTEVTGWPYRRLRDLTGFIDGTENPPLVEAPAVVAVPDGEPGAGSSVVLVQQWTHHVADWTALDTRAQELVIGRTKADSVELDEAEMPPDSHVARNVIEENGEELAIFRRNTPYGGVTDHGTMFVGFCARQRVLALMLDRMAGVGDGVRDALTRYSTPLTGAYYVVPSVDALRGWR
ncbi:MAG TPA: Dyp-type peroxidase [Sporichthyaceae bacterium]|jgi:putative iron-dependent peroxidase